MLQAHLGERGGVAPPGVHERPRLLRHRLLGVAPVFRGLVALGGQVVEAAVFGREAARGAGGTLGEGAHVPDRLLAAVGRGGDRVPGPAEGRLLDPCRGLAAAVGKRERREHGVVVAPGPSRVGGQPTGLDRGGDRRPARRRRRDGAVPVGLAAVPEPLGVVVEPPRPVSGGAGQPGQLLGAVEALDLGSGGKLLYRGAGGAKIALAQFQRCGGGGLRLAGADEVVAHGDELAVGGLVGGLGGAQLGGLAARGDAGVVAVAPEEALDMAAGLLQPAQLVALLLEVVERLGHVGQHRLVDRSQRLREGARQLVGVRALGELRRAELDQQVDQCVVTLGAEVEQVLVDRSPVRLGVVEDPAGIAQRLDEPVTHERGAHLADQAQVHTDPPRGDEEPAGGDPAAGDGLEAAAEGEVRGAAILGEAAELQPGVAEPLLVATAEQEVPLHPLARVGVGLDPMGGQLAVQQERQHEREHLGLAGAVVAAQQQVAVAEAELLVVVEEQVDKAGPQRLPSFVSGQRQPAGAVAGTPVLAVQVRALPVASGGHRAAPRLGWRTGSA